MRQPPRAIKKAISEQKAIFRRHAAPVAHLDELEALKTQPEAFKAKLKDLHAALTSHAQARGEYKKIPLEVSFYRWDLFYRSLLAYGFCFLLIAFTWLFPHSKWLRRGAWGLLGLATLLLTVGIILRCVIRGRPPVSTLYETILFITWGCVLVAILIEWINRQRVAFALAPILGAVGTWLSTLYEFKEAVTAGDTMSSLRAVLDTNFWLSTHVTTITLGYSAGLLAAALAHVWILGKFFGLKSEDRAFYRSITRMTYGVLCFGLLLSIVGTILGGVWANYSWGRFWGWDPKENGALLICIWELVILHARFGGYIRDFGLAVMSILGGLVVAFSWWGVNLLSIGLHSYGFTSGIFWTLVGFYSLELSVVALGCVWWYLNWANSVAIAAERKLWLGGPEKG